jgi:hypothetical protein
MAAPKGSRNSTGRPKGSVNSDTSYIRFRFEQLLNGYEIEQMKADLMECSPVDRIKLVIGLAEFIIPKLQRTTVEGEGSELVIKVIRE